MRIHPFQVAIGGLLLALTPALLRAECGDPQLKTDHPWYPGELSCSTFPRLFKTQADLYKRVTGRSVDSDEDKALAAWYWRNLNYAHAEEGKPDTFDKGPKNEWNREYWTGLFGYGFGLCGTTHCQWTAEMNELLGHCRGRVAGVSGHNSFEVYLTGGAYGQGDWVLLDHDVSTVIFDDEGKRMLGITAIKPQVNKYKEQGYKPERQKGWLVAGLHPKDAAAYDSFSTAEYVDGYAGPTPMVRLRAGEALRRYPAPGLEDGKTYVFWGRNYNDNNIPGPARTQSWVNQPEKMYQAKASTPYNVGQVRFANAVYTYTPDFANGGYKEGAIADEKDSVTFEFYTPYVIGCTPPNNGAWGIYDAGGKNGLVLKGKMTCPVSVSTDQGKTWQDGGAAKDGLDLTDLVKGHQQYFIRFGANAAALKGSGLTLVTVCECNTAIVPRLQPGANKITFEASGLGLISAGPNKDQAEARRVAGAMDSNTVTLELKTPRGEKAVRVYAASWQASGAPPKPGVKYNIDFSVDGGKTWAPVVKDWEVVRRDPEPGDWWSQSMTWGDVELKDVTGPVQVRFSNTGGKSYRKVEAHLAYRVQKQSPVDVTFCYAEGKAAPKTVSKTFNATPGKPDTSWTLSAGVDVATKWVEYKCK